MGDVRSMSAGDSKLVTVDPYALVQAILGSRSESVAGDRRADSVVDRDHERSMLDYDDFPDLRADMMLARDGERQMPKPDDQPKNVRVGCANPYALVEAMLGRRIDRHSVNCATLISQVLQTDYDELFDMKNRSVLFAGLELDDKERTARQLTEKDLRLLRERDLVTPDLSRVRHLGDLEKIGVKDLTQARVKHARITNGKIRLTINANADGSHIARQVSNRELTRTLNELMTPFRMRGGSGQGGGDDDDNNQDERDRRSWSPPNGSWRDMYDYFFQSVNQRLIDDVTNFSIGDHMYRHRQRLNDRAEHSGFFDDPEQGACPNSWFVAALFSVFWADPASINRATRVHAPSDRTGGGGGGGGSGPNNNNNNNGGRQEHRLRVRFHDKGGPNNSRTETVEVNYEIPITNSSNEPIYCRASDRTDIWPSLYEKAFAKWISNGDNHNNRSGSGSGSSSGDRPDITVTHSGDPVKCMAQIHGREPMYFRCDKHDHNDLLSVVRNNCVNNRTINPMCAWTHATGPMYRGSNLVANHAYSVCGYAIVGDRQYIVLRNPFGVTECQGLTSYAGILSRMDPELWQPAELMDQGGLFAMETQAFKDAFQYMGCCV